MLTILLASVFNSFFQFLFICLAHYERLFKDLQAQVHGEAVTGLLLIYPVHIIHVVEVRKYCICVTGRGGRGEECVSRGRGSRG